MGIIEIEEELFFSREFCDEVRKIGLESAITMQDAINILCLSKNIQRDSIVVMELANVGINVVDIKNLVNRLNEFALT